MKDNSLKIPIALSNETGKLVNPEDVTEGGLKCNCICPACSKNVIAIKGGDDKTQRPHFRHNVDTCSYETYIHELAKKIFNEIDEIHLPPIRFFNFLPKWKIKFKNEIRKHLNLNGIITNEKTIESFDLNYLEIKNNIKVRIESFTQEETRNSIHGIARIDIIIKSKNQELFIEPCYSHSIDDIKERKLENINVSTVSIDLRSYSERMNNIFTKENFRDFVANEIESKHWIWINSSEVENAITEFITSQFSEENLNKYKNNKEQISINKRKISVIENKKFDLEREVSLLKQEIEQMERYSLNRIIHSKQ